VPYKHDGQVGAGNKCINNKRLREIILTTGNKGNKHTSNTNDLLWLDWATIQFMFIGPASRYTGSFCVFGPVLSSPAHAAESLDMPPI
jgi:hypothetical protein